jgi:hypothetical protein
MLEVKGTVIIIFLDHPFGEFNDSRDLEQATAMQRMIEFEWMQIEIAFEFFPASLKNFVV